MKTKNGDVREGEMRILLALQPPTGWLYLIDHKDVAIVTLRAGLPKQLK